MNSLSGLIPVAMFAIVMLGWFGFAAIFLLKSSRCRKVLPGISHQLVGKEQKDLFFRMNSFGSASGA